MHEMAKQERCLLRKVTITPSNIQAFCVTNDSIGGQAADFIISSEQAAINSHLLNSTDMIKLNANIANLTKDLMKDIKQFSLENKIQTKVLDYFNQELPRDYDVALLSHIVHLYDEEKARALLKKVYDSLPSEHGIIIISEWLLNDEKTGPVPSALMSLNMIVELERGRNYSFAEISKILTDVGFRNIEKRSLAGPAEIVRGHKK